MKKSYTSPSWVKFWRYVFLSLSCLMVLSLYVLATVGAPKTFVSKAQGYPHAQTDIQAIDKKPQTKDDFKVSYLNVCQADDISVPTCQELRYKFNERNYHLIKGEQDQYRVARVYLASFPQDFARLNYGEKKNMFLKSLLPLILQANEDILSERKKLLRIMHLKRSGLNLSQDHHRWLSEMAVKYRVKRMCLNELSERIDVIPVSLALSQAITETGWGTSPAAKRKNSPFGFTVANRVLSYESLRHSVRAYIQTLNSHAAYKPLRKIRATIRKNSDSLCGHELAKGLINYSTRGHAYIREIQQVISNNNLKQFDSAQLQNRL